MASNEDSTKPIFKRSPNYADVWKKVKIFKHNNYSVIILLSIWGWNSPHVDTNFTAEDYFQKWLNFNEKITNIIMIFMVLVALIKI